MQFDVHPVRCFEHCGFVLLRKGERKKVVILYPKPMPQKRPHFTTQNVGTHSGCPRFGRSFASIFGPRSGAHVSGTGAGPQQERYQTQERRNICPDMPMFFDSGRNASHMVLGHSLLSGRFQMCSFLFAAAAFCSYSVPCILHVLCAM